jgi:hypothetical protein
MTEFDDTEHGKCKIVYIPAPLTDAEQAIVYSKVLAMRNWTRYRFVRTQDMVAIEADGVTNWRLDAAGHNLGAAHE